MQQPRIQNFDSLFFKCCFLGSLSSLLLSCALESKEDRGFVKKADEPETSSSRPAPIASDLSADKGNDASKASAANSGTKPGTTDPTSASAKLAPVGSCGEGKVLGPAFSVNTGSGVNVRKEALSTSERLGGFSNSVKVVSWIPKNTPPATTIEWQCVTGKETGDQEITGWVLSAFLKPE